MSINKIDILKKLQESCKKYVDYSNIDYIGYDPFLYVRKDDMVLYFGITDTGKLYIYDGWSGNGNTYLQNCIILGKPSLKNIKYVFTTFKDTSRGDIQKLDKYIQLDNKYNKKCCICL